MYLEIQSSRKTPPHLSPNRPKKPKKASYVKKYGKVVTLGRLLLGYLHIGGPPPPLCLLSTQFTGATASPRAHSSDNFSEALDFSLTNTFFGQFASPAGMGFFCRRYLQCTGLL